uniref:ERCC4 domain-containing protein n=1 Tax=Wuchereria bancrofti TaxID=6293 RepID=A0AAF5Q3A8_WUCBA
MDKSIIVLSEDEDGNELKRQLNDLNIPKNYINDEILEYDEGQAKEELMPSSSRFLDDTHSRALLELNDAAFLDLVSSDNESNDSYEKPRCALDGIPESEDFANWYSNESFSQPVQSSPMLKEIQLNTNEFVASSTSDKRSSICIARSVSDGVCMERKRKKRTKDEINAERAAKEEAREKRKQERIEKKKRTELEKQLAKFEREVSAAKKSKCEQNLFCVISLDLISAVDNLDELIMKIFTDRGIRDQLLFEDAGMTVCWKRRVLQGEVENNEFIRGEKLMYEQFCILSMNAQRYDQFKSAEDIAKFIEECLKKYPFPSPQLTLVVYGSLKLRKEKASVADFVLEIFERFRAQTRFVLSAQEYAVLIAQMHRSIARNASRLEEQILPIVNIEKGITEGDDSAIISDWWMKMLSQMHRMGTNAQRTIVKTFPSPHALSKLLRTMPMKEGMKMLADTKMDYGKRIGPVLARKIYLMLTSVTGTEIIDES